jgi:hypothetical protein
VPTHGLGTRLAVIDHKKYMDVGVALATGALEAPAAMSTSLT